MVQSPINRRLPLLISAALLMLGFASARAQWAVYDMRMVADQESSVNFIHYSGAYVLAPLDGGPATLIFTTEEEGRFYAVAQNAARFFVAGNQVKRRAVVSATATVGTSQSMYLASGPLNNTFQYTQFGNRKVAIIASDIYGHLMTSDDESLSTIPAIDGSLGVVGVASFKGFFRKDLSERLSAEALTIDQAIESITGLLEKYGYQSESNTPSSAPKTVAPQPAQVLNPVTVPATGPMYNTSSGSAEGSLFPAGLRDEAEQSLIQQFITK